MKRIALELEVFAVLVNVCGWVCKWWAHSERSLNFGVVVMIETPLRALPIIQPLYIRSIREG